MRIIKALITSAVLALALTSCGNNDNAQPSQSATASPSASETASPQATSMGKKVGDTANDVVDGAEKQVDDMADTTKKVVDDVTK